MGQCVGMWPAHHGHSDQQRGHHPSNIAGLLSKREKKVLDGLDPTVQCLDWTWYTSPPHNSWARTNHMLPSTHERGGQEVWPFHISSRRGPEILGELLWWLPDQEIYCIWRWGMSSSGSAFKYLDHEHSACRWQSLTQDYLGPAPRLLNTKLRCGHSSPPRYTLPSLNKLQGHFSPLSENSPLRRKTHTHKENWIQCKLGNFTKKIFSMSKPCLKLFSVHFN